MKVKNSDLIYGYDISHWQTEKEYQGIVESAGFVIYKATQGAKMIDTTTPKRINEAIRRGKRTGVYHFLDGTTSGELQAEHFYLNVRPWINKLEKFYPDGEPIPLLFFADFEKLFTNNFYELKKFLEKFESLSGYRPIIYTSYSWFCNFDWSNFKNYKFWIAGYTKLDKVLERINKHSNIVLYQYSDAPFDSDMWVKTRMDWESEKHV
ncbi:MAG: hypothetical protein MJ237_08595 [bacterium]|nr:hypothetical protein [bacterium]